MTTLPQDKTQYAIADDVIRQTDCTYKFGNKEMLLTLRFMGDQAGATQLAMSYREGSAVSTSDTFNKFGELSVMHSTDFKTYGQVTSSQAVTKKGSALATISISIPYDKKIVLSSDLDEIKQVTWSEKSTKYQFSLGVYAGEVSSSSQDYACAGDYQAWLEENGKDADNYKNFQYTAKNGTIVALSARTLDLAKKRYADIENVERAYPEVVRTTTYQYIHGDDVSADEDVIRKIDEQPNLYYIDNSISSVWKDKFSGFSWLKAAYDIDIQASEYEDYWNATVVESWIGISEEERGPWDKNLYGSGGDRWKFFRESSEPTPPTPDFPPIPDEDDPEYEEKIMTTWIQYTDNTVSGLIVEGTWNGSEIAEDKISTILNIDFGQAISSIASNVFYGYPELRDVYVPTTVTAIAENAFLSGPDDVSFIGRTEAEISSIANYPWGMDPEHILVYE